MHTELLIEKIQKGEMDDRLLDIYVDESRLDYQRKRYVNAMKQFETYYGSDDVMVFSAPGRSEVGGNHTDHQHGEVLAASINLDTIGIVKATSDNKIRVKSDEYDEVVISLEDITIKPEERETTTALIKGVVAGFVEREFAVGGYFNACGAHPNGKIGEAHNPETHLIPLILQVPNGKREYISVYGNDYDTKDGTCVRDYIHVNDLAQAHILAMEYLENGGESDIFNLGNGVGFSVKEVIETARKVTNHLIPAKEEERRTGDPSVLIASSDKAKEILGWKPQYADLETIIKTAWEWHENYPNGY